MTTAETVTRGAGRREVRPPRRVVLLSESPGLAALLERALAARGAADWVADLAAAGVPCGLVNDVGEAFALAERLGLGPVADAGGVPQVASPIGLSATPASYRLAPPALGEHTAKVLRWLATPPQPGAATLGQS